MNDAQMDARLREAGERWRADNPATIEGSDHSEGLLDLQRPHSLRPNRWVALASAAVVAAALLVGGILFANRHTQPRSGDVGAKPAVPLRGTTWYDKASGATATFGQRTALLSNGCSVSKNALTVNGDSMTIGKSITQSVCSLPAPPQTGVFHAQYLLKASADSKFFKTFGGPVHWSISGDYLTIRTSDGSTLELGTKHGIALTVFDHPWTLKYVIDAGENELAGNSVPGSLTFNRDGTVTGLDECSNLSGSAHVTDTSMVFSRMVEIGHRCASPHASAPASMIRDVLDGEASFGVRLGELTITKKNLGTLIYVPEEATKQVAPSDLIDVDWTLTGTETSASSGNTSSGSGSSAVSQSVLRFDGNGGFTITHRCYTNHGRADLGSGTAALSDVTLLSALPCPSDTKAAAEQRENAFIDALLKGTVTWSIDGQQLAISKGSMSATFDNDALDAPAPLLRFTWYLQSVRMGGPRDTGSKAKTHLPLWIESGTLHVGKDCRAATGSVRLVTRDELKIGALSFADSSCFGPGPSTDQIAVAHILHGTVSYQITGDQLTITKNGVGQLVFTKS